MVTANLHTEVLARMRALGVDRAVTASVVANHGERRSTNAVWLALEALWENGQVEQLAHEKWRLAPAPAGVQLEVGDTPPDTRGQR